jgi:PAS domain-containing protein
VAIMNVSARKRAEEESARFLAAGLAARRSLTDQTERLNSLIAAVSPGVLFVDERNVIIQLNQSLCDLLGLKDPASQLIGSPAGRLMREVRQTFSDPDDAVDRWRRYRADRQPAAGMQFACVDGRTIECDYRPVFVGGQYRGDLWLLQDVPEDHDGRG